MGDKKPDYSFLRMFRPAGAVSLLFFPLMLILSNASAANIAPEADTETTTISLPNTLSKINLNYDLKDKVFKLPKIKTNHYFLSNRALSFNKQILNITFNSSSNTPKKLKPVRINTITVESDTVEGDDQDAESFAAASTPTKASKSSSKTAPALKKSILIEIKQFVLNIFKK